MANFKPPLLIKGVILEAAVNGDSASWYTAPENSPNAMWDGTPTEWILKCRIENPQMHSNAEDNFQYDATNVKVGQWLASQDGRAVKIVELYPIWEGGNHYNEFFCRTKDVDNYLLLSDPTQGGQTIGSIDHFFVFEEDEDGFPIIDYLGPYVMDVTAVSNIMSRFSKQNSTKIRVTKTDGTPIRTNLIEFTGTGVDIVEENGVAKVTITGGGGTGSGFLETPADGDYIGGAVTGWEIGTTSVSTAIDDLNETLAKLLPARPPALSTKTLTVNGGITSRNGANILLADGTPNNTTTSILSGTTITTCFTTSVLSNDVTGFDSGNSGILSSFINDVTTGSVTLTKENNTGTYDGLVVLADNDYPSDKPGFWQALDVRMNGTVVEGINNLKLTHSETGTCTINFVSDRAITPQITDFIVATNETNYVYSSGIPHLTTGSNIQVNCTATNLSANTYLSANIVRFTTGSNIGNLSIGPGQAGLPTVLLRDTLSHNIPTQNVTLSGSFHTTSTIVARASNPYADSTDNVSSKSINYMSGNPSGIMIESPHTRGGIPFKRVALGSGERPTTVFTTYSSATWNSGSSSVIGDASASWEATVRGGKVRHDQNNYSDGNWVPGGPNYSSKDAVQYISFVLQKVTSNIKIEFVGSDPAGFWIKLPEIATRTSRSMPNAAGGWWDAKRQLNFPAGSYPGSSSANDGCLKQKTGQRYECSFGILSSVDSLDNTIYLRVKLTAGQTINDIIITF